jgi:AraC-like DNA-binding protein
MVVQVKNMVCDRCLKVVKNIFIEAGAIIDNIQLGTVDLRSDLDPQQQEAIKTRLSSEGFEWLDDQKAKVIAQIKQLIIDLVHYGELDEMKFNLSELLSTKLHKDYHYLSNLFSSLEETTIEQYFILQKIERVKELLTYNESTLSEIAIKLGYSSSAYLSSQFKKITGLTPSQYKKGNEPRRIQLDKL